MNGQGANCGFLCLAAGALLASGERHRRLLVGLFAIGLLLLLATKSRTTLGAIHVLTAITRTCLLHYQELEKKHGHVPILDRQMMVVDMEKWKNRIRALNFMLFAQPS